MCILPAQIHRRELLKKLPVSFDSVPVQDVEQQRPLLVANPNPRGAEWLWSPIAMRMYVSLAVCSTRPLTKEAAVGALQNITAENQGVRWDGSALVVC